MFLTQNIPICDLKLKQLLQEAIKGKMQRGIMAVEQYQRVKVLDDPVRRAWDTARGEDLA
jgi:hypothetical protein